MYIPVMPAINAADNLAEQLEARKKKEPKYSPTYIYSFRGRRKLSDEEMERLGKYIAEIIDGTDWHFEQDINVWSNDKSREIKVL